MAWKRHQQRVAVRLCLRDRPGSDGAAGAGAIVDDDGLAKLLADALADQSRQDIGDAAGAGRHDHLDRAGRVILRHRAGRQSEWATRMTRASNRACSSNRTFRLPGWRCFRRPATSSISRSRRCSTKRSSASWRWRKRIAGRRAILPRGVLEDGATAPVRRVGSIRAVQGRRTMTSLLDALPKLRPINHGYLGVRRAARRECFPHQRRAKFQKRPYFSVDGAHGQGAKYAAKYANKAV